MESKQIIVGSKDEINQHFRNQVKFGKILELPKATIETQIEDVCETKSGLSMVFFAKPIWGRSRVGVAIESAYVHIRC